MEINDSLYANGRLKKMPREGFGTITCSFSYKASHGILLHLQTQASWLLPNPYTLFLFRRAYTRQCLCWLNRW